MGFLDAGHRVCLQLLFVPRKPAWRVAFRNVVPIEPHNSAIAAQWCSRNTLKGAADAHGDNSLCTRLCRPAATGLGAGT